jgi:hypothetical protein
MTVLSASSVSTYEDCHLMWYFTYVEMRPEPPNEPRETGILMHDYAEAILKGEGEVGWPDGAPLGTLLPLADVFDQQIVPTYSEPVLIEAAFELDVEGIEYTGFIDSVDKQDDPLGAMWGARGYRVVLRDLKTTKNRPRKGKYRDNLIGYGEGAKALGYPPDTYRLDYIVRTQTPYYWPEDQEVADPDEIDIWAANVVRVHRSIEEGDWEATGVGTYVCSYCPFKDICGPYDRWLELTSPLRQE